jgi:WhiB family transcriptional regulator, redox-sensing transcriptional regulator
VFVQDDWRQDAACKGADIDLFFAIDDEGIGHAKEICAVCPVRHECLEWALTNHQDDGIWGGFTEVERRRIRRRRRTAARVAAA